MYANKLYLSIIKYMSLYINSISFETIGKMSEIIPTTNESLLIHWHWSLMTLVNITKSFVLIKTSLTVPVFHHSLMCHGY